MNKVESILYTTIEKRYNHHMINVSVERRYSIKESEFLDFCKDQGISESVAYLYLAKLKNDEVMQKMHIKPLY